MGALSGHRETEEFHGKAQYAFWVGTMRGVALAVMVSEEASVSLLSEDSEWTCDISTIPTATS